MKNIEIRELATSEIVEKIKSEKEGLVRLRLNHSVSPIEKPQQFGQTKKTIARLKTELRKREIQNL